MGAAGMTKPSKSSSRWVADHDSEVFVNRDREIWFSFARRCWLVASEFSPANPAWDSIPASRCLGEFSADQVFDESLGRRGTDGSQLAMSAMAPNISFNTDVNYGRSHLLELALDFATGSPAHGGGFRTRVFLGREFESFMRALRAAWGTVKVRKPSASRGTLSLGA